MKKIDHQLITVPLEFKVACRIYMISVQEVLQIFINHATVFDSTSRIYSQGYTEAVTTITHYILAKELNPAPSKAFAKCKDTATSCLSMIVGLGRKKTGQALTKRRQCRTPVTLLFETMKRVYAPKDKLYLDEDSVLVLTKDFCVLCEIHNCYPKEYLEYFMNKISLADAHSRKALKIEQPDSCYALYFLIADGFERDISIIATLTDLEMDFYDRMQEIRLELYPIRDLGQRTVLLREFYLDYYYQLIQQP